MVVLRDGYTCKSKVIKARKKKLHPVKQPVLVFQLSICCCLYTEINLVAYIFHLKNWRLNRRDNQILLWPVRSVQYYSSGHSSYIVDYHLDQRPSSHFIGYFSELVLGKRLGRVSVKHPLHSAEEGQFPDKASLKNYKIINSKRKGRRRRRKFSIYSLDYLPEKHGYLTLVKN